MEKFKKFLKVFLALTLILGVGAYFICLGVMPNETKAFTDIVVDYLNRPLGIVFGCTITLGGLIYFFVAYTSVGKKTLNYLKSQIENIKAKSEQAVEKSKEYYELIVKEKEQLIAISSAVCGKVDNLTEYLVNICETSPNAKIKAIGEQIKEKKNDYKVEIETNLHDINDNVNEYIESKVNVKELENQINELTAIVERLVKEYGEEKPND